MGQVHSDAMASGYTMALRWCLRCDVGETGMEECWLCGSSDAVLRWTMRDGVWRMVPTD